DGVVDIYMPDFKVWNPSIAAKWLGAKDYPEVTRSAIAEMHRQVGDLAFDDAGLAVRGVLVRHLVMPGNLGDTAAILRWLAETLGTGTYVNVMGQYRPDYRVVREPGHWPQLERGITNDEHRRALAAAHAVGLHRMDRRVRRPRPIYVP
ncbi:MAG: hypothetical protein R6W77_11850, partial [Trueperaceae bacterium]